ncbi:unnamed protein product [Symbiodinium natans]|uniref:Uncharacterized protein n=1 Tax=Symbiodinium natans TaxID=878477 RepID=A0A812TSW0_9DINO|nr:unnamed protein product [Symbiodinium natans]
MVRRCKACAFLLLAAALSASTWPSFTGGQPRMRRPRLARPASPERPELDDPRQAQAAGELPDWLMEATGGVPKEEEPRGGVDFSWDYRVVSAVIFALGLLYVGIQG